MAVFIQMDILACLCFAAHVGPVAWPWKQQLKAALEGQQQQQGAQGWRDEEQHGLQHTERKHQAPGRPSGPAVQQSSGQLQQQQQKQQQQPQEKDQSKSSHPDRGGAPPKKKLKKGLAFTQAEQRPQNQSPTSGGVWHGNQYAVSNTRCAG
jgi:hypothetical protein